MWNSQWSTGTPSQEREGKFHFVLPAPPRVKKTGQGPYMWLKKYCLGCSPLQQAARLHVLSIFTASTHQCCFAGQKPFWFSMNCNQFLFSELELDFKRKYQIQNFLFYVWNWHQGTWFWKQKNDQNWGKLDINLPHVISVSENRTRTRLGIPLYIIYPDPESRMCGTGTETVLIYF